MPSLWVRFTLLWLDPMVLSTNMRSYPVHGLKYANGLQELCWRCCSERVGTKSILAKSAPQSGQGCFRQHMNIGVALLLHIKIDVALFGAEVLANK